MFRFHKSPDIVTVFHKASSPASIRVANLVKHISANAQAGATLDQASDHTAQTQANRDPFELNITEEPPTVEQVQTILDYVGRTSIAKVIKGARDEKDALKKFRESKESFLRPVTVDWNNGKAIAGDNESQILKLLKTQKSE
ncbi:Thioredoxin-like fold protein [Metarhizium album ARSEF 1941]|uniref:Thioredoxin-like fold protein n=1 Tax=Metarhizium album (strain ARSEF 1941) TaxID=1081103 RepID=A0A0B2X318_METAS|nr:Thioredoxin-like fold protein [Metarhizium album ARSEF 1941]KHO00153.1 Thioredoxin-like fold protein [Metarhizium album ARSEF 1941]